MNKKSVLTTKEKEKFLEVIGEEGEKIDETAKLSWDGSSVLLRLPKAVADYFEVNQETAKFNEIRFFIKEKRERGKMKVIKTFEIKKRRENETTKES